MADPRSLNLPASGVATQQYELAPGLAQYVQSVYVEFDNTAGGDARPVLTLSEQSGVVIAKKRQGETIPAGEANGSATWALRLDDERHASSGATIQSASYSGSHVNIASFATGTILWDSFDAGDDLLDITTPAAPTVRAAGFYIVTSLVQCAAGGISFRQSFGFSSAGPGSFAVGLTGDLGGLGATGYVTLTIAAQLAAGDGIFAQVFNHSGFAAHFFELQGSVARIA